MKGIIFSELLEMTEEVFGFEVLEKVVSSLPHRGIYVAGGYYPHAELIHILSVLAKEVASSPEKLMHDHGKRLFGILIGQSPHFADGQTNSLDLIASVDEVIHVEVKKLYPEAVLPRLEVVLRSAKQLKLDYTSPHQMEHFALGLMRGCAAHFGDELSITHELIDSQDHKVRFTLDLQ